MTVTPGSLVVDYAHARLWQLTDTVLGNLNPAAVCRYVLDAARDEGKALTLGEADWLGERGLPILCNFEYATDPLLTAAQGAADARIAHAALLGAGMPSDSPVAFSMDRDLFISEIPAVLDYWSGAQSVLGYGKGLNGKAYPRAGLYGEYDLIDAAGRKGVHWLWQASAWSRGLLSPYALLYQVHNNFIPGYDKNLAQAADFGQRFPLGYGDDMNLSDKTKVGSLYTLWPPESKVTANTEFTVAELLIAAAARPAQLQSALGAESRVAAARAADTKAGLADLVAAVKAGGVDVHVLADLLHVQLGPELAISLADQISAIRLRVEPS